MADYACLIQQDQTPSRKRDELEAGLRRIGRERLGDAASGIEVRWQEVDRGFGFTAGAGGGGTVAVSSPESVTVSSSFAGGGS